MNDSVTVGLILYLNLLQSLVITQYLSISLHSLQFYTEKKTGNTLIQILLHVVYSILKYLNAKKPGKFNENTF